MLLGSSTVQICTGVMLQGVKMIDELKEGVEKFMVDKGFNSVRRSSARAFRIFNAHGSRAANESGEAIESRRGEPR